MRQELLEEALILRTHIKKLTALMTLLGKAADAVDELLTSEEAVTGEDVQTIRETNDIITEQLDQENDTSVVIGVEKLAEVMAVEH